MSEDQQLSPSTRAKIASKAQAAAHKALREARPEEYRAEYQRAKDELTQRELRRQGHKT